MKRYLRWLLIAALVMGYPVLMHYTNVANTPGDGGAGSDNALHARHLGALVAIAPIVLLAGLMFVVEYCIRVRVFPHVKAAPILDGIRA